MVDFVSNKIHTHFRTAATVHVHFLKKTKNAIVNCFYSFMSHSAIVKKKKKNQKLHHPHLDWLPVSLAFFILYIAFTKVDFFKISFPAQREHVSQLG